MLPLVVASCDHVVICIGDATAWVSSVRCLILEREIRPLMGIVRCPSIVHIHFFGAAHILQSVRRFLSCFILVYCTNLHARWLFCQMVYFRILFCIAFFTLGKHC